MRLSKGTLLNYSRSGIFDVQTAIYKHRVIKLISIECLYIFIYPNSSAYTHQWEKSEYKVLINFLKLAK